MDRLAFDQMMDRIRLTNYPDQTNLVRELLKLPELDMHSLKRLIGDCSKNLEAIELLVSKIIDLTNPTNSTPETTLIDYATTLISAIERINIIQSQSEDIELKKHLDRLISRLTLSCMDSKLSYYISEEGVQILFVQNNLSSYEINRLTNRLYKLSTQGTDPISLSEEQFCKLFALTTGNTFSQNKLIDLLLSQIEIDEEAGHDYNESISKILMALHYCKDNIDHIRTLVTNLVSYDVVDQGSLETARQLTRPDGAMQFLISVKIAEQAILSQDYKLFNSLNSVLREWIAKLIGEGMYLKDGELVAGSVSREALYYLRGRHLSPNMPQADPVGAASLLNSSGKSLHLA